MTQRLVALGAGVVVLLIVVSAVLARPSGGQDVAVDTTGATGAKTARAVGSATPATTAATPTPGSPTPTPVVVQIQRASLSMKPLVLLNPSTVRQGSSVGVTGSGFDPGAVVDVYVKQQVSDEVDPLTFVQVDKSGGFGGVTFAVPDSLPRGSFIVEAQQRKSDNVARATAVVAGGSPQVKLGTQAGKAGDIVQLSASGFGPDEDIDVYFNDLSGDVIGTLHSDAAGDLRQGSVRMPFGAVGNNALVFVGHTSQSPVTVPFQMLNLYPSVDLSSYAIKADHVLTFSGKDFGPDEQVSVYLNNPDGPPLRRIQADETGSFTNAGAFLVPFGLRGNQTLIFVGQQSKAPTTASFDMLPYTPSAQSSTYGGRPGTALSFYAIGFARNEVVHAFLGRTSDSPGQEVSCFRTDPQGNVAAGGSFVVPGDAQSGQMIFTLVGSKSQATATAALEVIGSDVPVQVPPQAPFVCDQTDGPDGPQDVGDVDALQAEVAAASTPTLLRPSAPAPGAQPSPTQQPSKTADGQDQPKQAPISPAQAQQQQQPAATPEPKASATPKAKPSPTPAPPTATPKLKPSPTPNQAKPGATAAAKP